MKLFSLPLIIMLICGTTLLGCGQKGPLYIQDKQTAPVIKADRKMPKSADTNADKKNSTIQEENTEEPSEAMQ